MKRCYLYFILIGLILSGKVTAQISHGGYPLPWDLPFAIETRSAEDDAVVSLPAFDVEEQLRIDREEQTDLKSGYRFAYKFMTNWTPANSGRWYTLENGMKVWRLVISSKNALSLNVLFSKYKLPHGARLFLYNMDRSEVLGSFTSANNSDEAILPVAPVEGDSLVIEYQEPEQVEFAGELEIGEVNHGYKEFKASGPIGDRANFYCMPPVVCFEDSETNYKDVSRSVVLMIVNGTTGCTGVLMNNTSNDKRPYLLTASHCLNGQFFIKNADYAKIAGNIVCYFNYDSPQCTPVEPGPVDQTMASTHFRAVDEKTDMLLLEMKENIPADYKAYMAGWNIADAGPAPYSGIHHPGASLKRVGIALGNIDLISYEIKYPAVVFKENAHWRVNSWEVGATAGGSSGSPLFDGNMRVIGALTGGFSLCGNTKSDYYYSVAASWISDQDTSQLKCWLDPSGDAYTCDGLDLDNSSVANEKISNAPDAPQITVSRSTKSIYINNRTDFTSGTFSITSIDGRLIEKGQFSGDGQTISMPTLQSGIYIIELRQQSKSYRQKVIF